jgi:Fe2+ or Zn2+ uptake regulation protein
MRQDFGSVLRGSGLQVTAQRLAVFRAVSDSPHITADGVTEAVRSELGTISRQSVYDALGVLVDKGIDYAAEFEQLDLAALKKDIADA